MTLQADLIQVERALWDAAGGNRAGYACHLAADALHIFPESGVFEREAVLDGVAAAEQGRSPWLARILDGRYGPVVDRPVEHRQRRAGEVARL